VVLTGGDLDHVGGLISLREGLAFTLYASAEVLGALDANSIFNVLDRRLVPRHALALLEPVELFGLEVEAFSVPGKVALYLEDPSKGTRAGDTVGLKITERTGGREFFFIPGCAAIDDPLAVRLRGAELVLFDGTLFTDDEMIVQGLSAKTGQRMGHVSISGPEGSIAALKSLGIGRRIFLHINNSNPVLRQDSPERRAVDAAGWEVAYDGMEINL
jgi:pyrroloquinoline quinone biosynthesis protein B